MAGEKTKYGACAPCVASLRPSFREAISRAERQVDYVTLVQRYPSDAEILHELCAIMAEVYMMNPEGNIRISGEWMDGHMVQEVFRELTDEHLVIVMAEFERLNVEIRNKKAYLRTSLYNSVFTFSAHITNAINADLAR